MGRIVHGGQRRPQGGMMSRFVGTSAHGDRASAVLAPGHAALVEGRSLFPTSVVDPAESPRVLVSGHNSAKVGARVTKGPWRGLPIYTLTLEERATCPASCGLWDACYGNAMPFARRHAHGPALIRALAREIDEKAEAHSAGFVIRLHVLGDFFSRAYALQWATWLHCYPGLRVWGYTAHARSGEIGWAVSALNQEFPDRCAIRFSEPAELPAREMQAGTIWKDGDAWQAADGIVCPAQTGATAACGTCGLCWAPAAAGKRILFLGHGKRHRGAAPAEPAAGEAPPVAVPAFGPAKTIAPAFGPAKTVAPAFGPATDAKINALRLAGSEWDDIGWAVFGREGFGNAVRRRAHAVGLACIRPPPPAVSGVAETIDADELLIRQWGQRHAPGIDLCRTWPAVLAHVNAKRREYLLPEFRLARVFGAGQALADVGASA